MSFKILRSDVLELSQSVSLFSDKISFNMVARESLFLHIDVGSVVVSRVRVDEEVGAKCKLEVRDSCNGSDMYSEFSMVGSCFVISLGSSEYDREA